MVQDGAQPYNPTTLNFQPWGAHLARQACRCEASWCSTVRSLSGEMGAAQQVSSVARRIASLSVACARRMYGSSSSGRPCAKFGRGPSMMRVQVSTAATPAIRA